MSLKISMARSVRKTFLLEVCDILAEGTVKDLDVSCHFSARSHFSLNQAKLSQLAVILEIISAIHAIISFVYLFFLFLGIWMEGVVTPHFL